MRNIWELICLRHEHRPSQVFLIDQQRELMWKSWQTLVAALCRLLYTILKTNLLPNCFGEGGWNEKTSPQDCIMGKLDGSVIVLLCKIFVSCNSWCITASIKLFILSPAPAPLPMQPSYPCLIECFMFRKYQHKSQPWEKLEMKCFRKFIVNAHCRNMKFLQRSVSSRKRLWMQFICKFFSRWF